MVELEANKPDKPWLFFWRAVLGGPTLRRGWLSLEDTAAAVGGNLDTKLGTAELGTVDCPWDGDIF